MSDYKASVVIPCKNREILLFECFRGLADQTLGRSQFEVVLVDDCSPEPLNGVAERARSELGLTIRYARTTESHGPAPARNLGASIASAPILAFTDSDCRPHPDWLARGLAAFADPRVALVAGPCLPKPGQPVKLTSKDHFMTEEHPSYPTMNTFYPRTVFERIGGFDASLSVRDPLGRAVEAADFDLAWRVIKAGYAKRFVREAIVYHEVEDLGLVGYVLEGTRYFFIPEIVRRYPQLRSELLTARIFLHPGMWLVYVSLIIVILAAAVQPWLLLLLPIMLLGRALIRTRSLRPARLLWFCASACLQLPLFLVMTLALIYGSVRYRSLVL
jgi:glycosyltransferase involved in cell wall biosynthesis